MLEEKYSPAKVEEKTQKYWQDKESFKVGEDLSKEKFYCLSMFPYPSGNLHMGHVRNYTIGDVIARYQRMLGKNVLQPIGWDAFGLPAENAAIERNIAPAKWTYENISNMKKQMQRLGFAYDWSREIITCSVEYYRWEQWLFLKMFEKGLVYKKDSEVNWDPVDQTVLANEQVVDGRGWRSGALVEKRKVAQWFLKITNYAEQLLDDLEQLDGWPEQVRTMQRNWIGKSVGVEIDFKVNGHKDILKVYTTRADTIFGVSFVALAAQHPIAEMVASKNRQVAEFIKKHCNIKTAEADLATVEKKGIDSGLTVIHPLTKKEIPVWITNYVLIDYGSGAVMGVPAHDQRDYEFAQEYNLPIYEVIKPVCNMQTDLSKAAFCEYGKLVNSTEFTGLLSQEAIKKISEKLAEFDLGREKINYRLRDWGVSRQRYWGAPIPIIYCHKCGAVPVPEKDLPVILPTEVDFSSGLTPLKDMPEFYEDNCPNCNEPAKRELDTFDTFVESSWYYARFISKNQNEKILDDRVKYWLPVDQYVGGIEHAVMHLLYARFIHKVLRDFGFVNVKEPFKNLLTQGMVLKDGAKMSKSKGNTVDPQSLIEHYGADTARLFSMFASAPEQTLEWSDSGVEGSYRFLKKLWQFAFLNQSMVIDENILRKENYDFDTGYEGITKEQKDFRRQMYNLLKQASVDMQKLQFNTVVSAGMKLFNLLLTVNKFSGDIAVNNGLIHEGLSILLRILNPIVPHITQYLWNKLEFGSCILKASWPKVCDAALKADKIELVVQINGKKRATINVKSDATEKDIEEIVLQDKKIQVYLENSVIKKIVLIPKRLINIVV